MNNLKARKLAIITCILDDWGGSEELWARSIPILKQEGINEVTILKNTINQAHPEYVKLKNEGARFIEFEGAKPLLKKIASKITYPLYRLLDKLGLVTYNWNTSGETVYKQLKTLSPDVVIISQGINFDGLLYAYQCLKLGIPYFIVAQKAVDFFWPQPGDRAYMRQTLQGALRCLFVSEHNKRLTEEQFGVRLANAEVVFNPLRNATGLLPMPSTTQGYKLACIGRLFVIDKGQDILLRILAQPKWKARNVSISFIGSGPDLEGLTEMAELLDVKNIAFYGYIGDLNTIWEKHHALILPSRSEGLPLTVIEAMSFGRTVITTNAGGNAEIIEHQQNGFIGEANETDFEIAMEAAWLKRDEWNDIGLKAAQRVKEVVPPHPEKQFVNTIVKYYK